MDNDTYEGWLNLYHELKAIKSPVQYIFEGKKKKRIPMDDGVFDSFIDEITLKMARVRAYLDAHGVPMPKPLWRYNSDDPTTWVSSPQFAYGHLL